MGAARILVRHDALLPAEIDPYYSSGVRVLARALRLFAGRRDGRPGQRLARALEQLGPVAIKLGQLLATRADIFGRTFAEDLGHLRDRLPPFGSREAREQVERELGRPVEAVFESFDDTPVAAASLAQAHRATLKDGRHVAVKVLRPGIERRLVADWAVLDLAGRLIERWVPPARRLEPLAFAQTVIQFVGAGRLPPQVQLQGVSGSHRLEPLASCRARSLPARLFTPP
ncbi:AarF/UbiB family protein, partial [uncultured Phenylobacterium sp.]|uniref:AarF/UbiB family protein n=1 Tax=uncultured Phenylobacterium sp. TaxID=349273 RepID=UPI0025EF1233